MSWNLNLKMIQELADGPMPRIAIETGTFRGNGTRVLARTFARVISIELSPTLHQEARMRLATPELKHIELIQGNSAERLPAILHTLPPDEQIFFFLDAHWSGDASVDWSQAKWKGFGVDTAHLANAGARPTPEQQCPLLEELSAIQHHCLGRALVLIDDMKNVPNNGPGLRDHEFPGENWSHLSRELIRSKVAPRLEWIRELETPSQWLISLRSLSGV